MPAKAAGIHCFYTLFRMNLNNTIMIKEKIGYKVSVFSWDKDNPEILTFYHMSEREMNDWVESLLSDPFNDVTYIVVENFKVNYECKVKIFD